MFHISSFSSENFPNVELGKSEFKDKKSNYKTVVIGENGTGKTRLLNEIISTIRNKYDKEKKYTKESSCVNLINERTFEKIVAISTSFNDKLPFSDNDKFSDEHYQYCGIRETSNASWTSSLMRKTLDNLLVCIENNDSPKIKKIMEFLGLSNRFRITFNLKKPNKFNLLEAKESDLVNYIHFYSQNTSRMQVEKIRDFSLEQARSIMNNFIPLMKASERNECYIEIKVSNKTEDIVGVFENLDILRRVGIISSVSLNLSKNEKASDYSFTNASSGEAQLLFTMTAFLRYVSNNCLVIIDEPEISLHPNWQIKYFSLLEILLSKVKGCHVIIATHSHFLISELEPEFSSLISLKYVRGRVEAETIASSTLGWSPESILYRVFNVRTLNSLYLESDLQKAHSMLYTDDCDFEELKRLNHKFQSLVLDETDPMNKFIATVQGYIDGNQ